MLISVLARRRVLRPLYALVLHGGLPGGPAGLAESPRLLLVAEAGVGDHGRCIDRLSGFGVDHRCVLGCADAEVAGLHGALGLANLAFFGSIDRIILDVEEGVVGGPGWIRYTQ